MWRLLVVVTAAAVACLSCPSLARGHELDAPALQHLAVTDGADSEVLSAQVNEADSGDNVPFGPGRTKRGFYDYGTPWERRVYGRRQTQNRRGWRKGLKNHRYPYDRRRQHHNYRGPDYGDFYHESSHKYDHAGYVETSSDTKFSPKTVSFAHAKASGVLRTSSTGGDAEGSG